MSKVLEEKLRAIINHAYKNSPAIEGVFKQVKLTPDDIQTIFDLDKIPVTSKDRLVELQQLKPPFGGFLAIPMEKLHHIFLSPGPLYEPHAGEKATKDSIREIIQIVGFKPGDVVINTFSYQLIPTGLIVDTVLNEMGITIIPAGVGNSDLQIKMMLDLKVSGYIGTPSWLIALINKADEIGVPIGGKIHLKRALLSAEPLPPQMRQLFVDSYGLRIINAYGTAEFGFLAYNDDGSMAMRLLESSIIQVVDPETGKAVNPGESGEVVVTSFNETYPLIRIGTGDLALLIDPEPGKSEQGECSIILVGRIGEAVKVRGMFIHPNQLRFAVGQFQSVKKFKGLVSRSDNRDLFRLEVVLEDGILDKDTVKEGLQNAIRSACRITVDKIEIISEDSLLDIDKILVDERIW